ncbi:hypothetical protein [Kamptonema formosum]|uniref:hypothetical protein n=1 Tax=Kamptonema formosum TaxID=331992 RepID=UPI00034BE0A6|nr:hypothetical protein [Oscillatoria sp. PCC 10802]
MDDIRSRAWELKQDLIEFVLEAEGDLAVALEAYVAGQSSKDRSDMTQRDMVTDSFLTEAKVGEKTPLELYVENRPSLSETDRNLLLSWQRSFTGLFAVSQILPDGFELMNWLTAKPYTVKPNPALSPEELGKLKQGDILLARIVPVSDTYWMFSGAYSPLGNLGKPKLAVAIGNFKAQYKNHLYSDAPDLLEEAWKSVEKYHREFIDFFGSDEVTMPGYQLNKKIAEFQEEVTQKRLDAAGIDESKSLADLAEDAGVGSAELKEAAVAAGADSKAADWLLDSKDSTKMVMPKVELPASLKKAEQVTALAHPRWGQVFLPTYSRFKALLEAEDGQTPEKQKLVRSYLEDREINPFIWHRLARQYPTQLEKVLREVLGRPDFCLERDLQELLKEFNKPVEPELPEIASVPVHLHELFLEAFAEVNKSPSKPKGKKKPGKGFQRA